MRDYYRAELKKHPLGKSGAGAEDVSNYLRGRYLNVCLIYEIQCKIEFFSQTLNRISTRQKKQTSSQIHRMHIKLKLKKRTTMTCI